MSVLSSLPVDKQLGRQPVPTQYEVTVVQADDRTAFVVVELRTNSGEQTFFFDPDSADLFGKQIREAAARARGGGLIIPAAPDVEAVRRDLNGQEPSG